MSTVLYTFKHLLDKYDVDIGGYVKDELWGLYLLDKPKRSRVAVSFIFSINT